MTRKFWLSASLAAIGIMSSATAFAWMRVGVFVGPPWPYYYPYPAPYYYPQPVVVQQLPPPVYVQQPAPVTSAPAPAPSTQNGMWYHCDNPKGYYPYVQQCPGGWKSVTPTPGK